MSYFAVITFDLANASSKDYENAYSDLSDIGFSKQIASSEGNNITLPTTTCAGEFNGNSAGDVRTDLANLVKNAFKARGFTSEIFIVVAGNWAWSHRTT